MKKLIIIIVSVFAVNTINAQSNDIASIDAINEIVLAKRPMESSKIRKEDLSYSESISGYDDAKSIKNLERTISAYSLKEESIYDNSEKASYSVAFNQNNANAIVIYDRNGDIVKSIEKYKHVKLPYQIAASISKDHPHFYIKEVTIFKEYKENYGFETIYRVVVRKGKKSKTLRFNK